MQDDCTALLRAKIYSSKFEEAETPSMASGIEVKKAMPLMLKYKGFRPISLDDSDLSTALVFVVERGLINQGSVAANKQRLH